MRRVENAFVRWFNRRNRRDGSLFRGRFTSRLIDSECYLENVIRYIDENPVSAQLVSVPDAYPHGSAYLRARGREPRWLAPATALATGETEARRRPLTSHELWVIERRLEKQTAADPLDDLIASTPPRIQRWMAEKARTADGTVPRLCLLSPRALQLAICDSRAGDEKWQVAPGSRKKDGWRVLLVGLSRDAVGLTGAETSLSLGIARSTVGHAILEHRLLLNADPTYCEKAALVLKRGLNITYGPPTGSDQRDDRAGLDCSGDRA